MRMLVTRAEASLFVAVVLVAVRNKLHCHISQHNLKPADRCPLAAFESGILWALLLLPFYPRKSLNMLQVLRLMEKMCNKHCCGFRILEDLSRGDAERPGAV